jgi:hypothetical protein
MAIQDVRSSTLPSLMVSRSLAIIASTSIFIEITVRRIVLGGAVAGPVVA